MFGVLDSGSAPWYNARVNNGEPLMRLVRFAALIWDFCFCDDPTPFSWSLFWDCLPNLWKEAA